MLEDFDIVDDEQKEVCEHDKAFVGNEVLNVKEAAAFLRCSVSTVYNDVTCGAIPYVQKGKRVLFLRSKLLEWLETMSVDVRTIYVQK